jgi:hypothetical protein
MEGGFFLCHWYFLLRAHMKKRRQKGVLDQETGAPKPDGPFDTESDEAARQEIPLNPIFSTISEERVQMK